MKKNINNKLIKKLIISLQILYILLFFATSIISNIYFTFWASVISLILSIINAINKGDFKALFILISIIEILFTVFIYLIPEAGIPAPIKLF